LFTYLWLRQERLGKGAAAVGAILFAASGAMAVRWLWQTTNAAALYPALLWIVRRTSDGKRSPVWIMALIALAYALAGFPAAMAYGAWLAAVYLVVGMIRRHPERSEGPVWMGGARNRLSGTTRPPRSLATLGMTTVLVLLIA